jgi:Family of unknown function (DUF5681)
VSDEQAEQPDKPLTGRARSLANLKPFVKGNKASKGRPKDLARLGDILMRELYKNVPASLAGKVVSTTQGELFVMQLVKAAINKGMSDRRLLLQFIEQHETRQARLEAAKLRKQAEGTSEIDWDAERQELYERLCKATGVQPIAQTNGEPNG